MGKRNLEKERYWREIAARFEGSGLKVRAFCDREQIKEHQFFAWRRELKRRATARTASQDDQRRNGRNDRQIPNTGADGMAFRQAGPDLTAQGVAFAPLHVVATPPTSPSSIEVIVADGRRVAVTPGFDLEALAQVLAVVERHQC